MIRPALSKRGVTTGQEMCDLIFQEASVAVSDIHADSLDSVYRI